MLHGQGGVPQGEQSVRSAAVYGGCIRPDRAGLTRHGLKSGAGGNTPDHAPSRRA